MDTPQELQSIPAGATRVIEVASANAIVGPVQRVENRLVIPLASVSAGYGFGYGFGREREEGEEESGGGGGGGGGGRARPVAVLEVTPEGVRLHQVVDPTRITLASLSLAAWTVFWITRTVRAFRRT